MSGGERGTRVPVHLAVSEHTEHLRQQLRSLLEHQPLFNVTCVCSDQTVRPAARNRTRMTIKNISGELQQSRYRIDLPPAAGS